GDGNGLYPFAPPVGDSVIFDGGTFAIAVLGYHQDILLHIVDGDHSDHLVLGIGQGDSTDPGGIPAHGPGLALLEPDGLPGLQAQEYLAGPCGELGFEQLVPIPYRDRIDAVLSWPGILLQGSLLDHALFGGHDHIMTVYIRFILQVLGTDEGLDLIIVLDIDQVLYGPTLGSPAAFRNFVDTHPETFSLLGKKEHVLVVGAHEQMFQKVFVPGRGCLLAHSSPVL